MSDNRRGVFLGCLGLILVAAFFIGVPTLIYFQFFHDQENNWSFDFSLGGKPDYLDLAEGALQTESFADALMYVDSALAEEETALAYDIAMRAQIKLEDWESLQLTVANILAMPNETEQLWVIESAPRYLPSPEADESLRQLMDQLAFLTDYENWETVSYDLYVTNTTAQVFFLENFLIWQGDDPIIHQELVSSLQEAERFEEAIASGKQYLATYGNEEDIMLNNVGYCYYRLGDYESAREYFSQAAEYGNEAAIRNLNRLKESRNK
ncbi:MAG: tetratricopeptide repeat protein [Bacteroidota bacterium]